MATDRLYYADSWLTSFVARVVGHAPWQGRTAVQLDRSAFYPDSGGQLPDLGTLAGVPVVDVQVDDDGVVHHVVEGAPPAIGAEVAGEIDRGRRRVHMALHTGQHMLSRALLDVAGAQTVSSRLGGTSCTIDLSRDGIPERELAAAEDLANAVVDDDVEVVASFPSAEELAAITLRREPKVDSEIRVVRIGDYDASPCGGTHCTRTGQVGLLHIIGVERYKGMTRVVFDAGPRARRALAAHSDELRAIGHGFSCGPEGVADALANLRRELGELRGEVKQLRLEAAARTAEQLVARSDGDRVVAVIAGESPEGLRAIAKCITAEPTRVCLLASVRDDGLHVMVARGEGSTFQCGEFLKRAATSAGGRGGGRPDRAEGRLPAGVDWPALVASLVSDR